MEEDDFLKKVTPAKYQKLDHISQILLRPDTYIGQPINKQRDEWVSESEILPGPNGVESITDRMSQQNINFNPGLARIFTEVLSNAIDNVWRSKEQKVKVSYLRIEVDDNGWTTIENDGMWIPIQKHDTENVYIPEMIFGQLLTSSNYDDDQKRFTSGRNGYGVKLTNIFSLEFNIEIYDPQLGLKYTQSWSNNMKSLTKPQITKMKKSQTGYTRVSFFPEFERFGLENYDEGTIKLFKRFAYDAAMITELKDVSFNNEPVIARTLSQYANYYLSTSLTESGLLSDYPEKLQFKSEDCDVILCSSINKPFVVSFVNGIYTPRGGVHVDDWLKAILQPMVKKINEKYGKTDKKTGKKTGGIKITQKEIMEHVCLFVKATLPNPQFDGQTKEVLEHPRPTVNVPATTTTKLMKWSVMTEIEHAMKSKQMRQLSKTDGVKKDYIRVEKADDANLAGTKSSKDCTLILTEGDSAKSFATQGISYLSNGQDYYGAYPLRGKILNVRKATFKMIEDNKIFAELKKLLGLRQNMDYTKDENFATLRYGSVLLLVDADPDGDHIKGLIMNMFHYLFPSLIERKYILGMRTPLVKVTLNRRVLEFHHLPYFKSWYEQRKDLKMTIDYYKGLGTSDDTEIQKAFENMRLIEYYPDEASTDSINLAFSDKGKMSDQRKDWMASYTRPEYEGEVVDPEDQIGMVVENQPISSFINSELVEYAIDSCRRALPSIMDGLKESQRMILFACFKRNLKTKLKVAQLAGYVSEQTDYHHGEQCLHDTITNMAQQFVGANNIPLLKECGQFGSRLQGGKDASAARYIHTHLWPLASYIFREEDMPILKYRENDGASVEPEYYVPIIPMCLVNGEVGIGTGYSTCIPSFNPLDLVEWIKAWLDAECPFYDHENTVMPELEPWYRGFKGSFEKRVVKGKVSFASFGDYEQIGDNKIRITELPIGVWTEQYHEFLDGLMERKSITKFKAYKSKYSVRFDVFGKHDGYLLNDKTLKLCSSDWRGKTLSLSNMVMFDSEDKPHRYEDLEEILHEYCGVRIDMYHARKNDQLRRLDIELRMARNRLRFIEEIMNEELVIYRQTKEAIEQLLIDGGYEKFENGYKYLLAMQMHTFSSQKLEKLGKNITDIQEKIDDLKVRTIPDLWKSDLDEFVVAYTKWLKEVEKEE